jgi:hypothetical protein
LRRTLADREKLPGDYADGMAVDGNALWVAVRFGTYANPISTADGSVLDKVSVPDRTADIEPTGAVLYSTGYRDRAVQRIQLAS